MVFIKPDGTSKKKDLGTIECTRKRCSASFATRTRGSSEINTEDSDNVQKYNSLVESAGINTYARLTYYDMKNPNYGM